jgi:hypothetical protein
MEGRALADLMIDISERLRRPKADFAVQMPVLEW